MEKAPALRRGFLVGDALACRAAAVGYNVCMPTALDRPRWSTATKLAVSLLLLALGIYLLYRFSVVVPPFILAVIVAFLLRPVVDRLQVRLRLPRTLATLFVYLILISLLILLPALIVPELVAQFQSLNLDLQQMIDGVRSVLGDTIVIGGVHLDSAEVVRQLQQSLGAMVEPMFGQTVGLLVDVITSFVWIVFIFVISFYLIKDSDKLWGWLEKLPPAEYLPDFLALKREFNAIWSDFFRGQLVLAFVVSLIFTVVGLVIGLPFALAMALFAGLMEFIPTLGHGIWLTVALLLTLSRGSTWLPLPNVVTAAIVLGLHLVFQQIDLNYLIPRVIGRRVRLHPLVVIMGIVLGASLAGVLGILLAAPTIASARVIGRYLKAYLFDLDPQRAAPA
jgi:predicted PurR-regulated permease PerM